MEPTKAIPEGGDDNLTDLTQVPPAGALPEIDPDSSDALDKLREQAEKAKAAEGDEPEVDPAVTPPADPPAVTPPADPPAVTPPPDPANPPAVTPPADPPAVTPPADVQAQIDKIELPPYTKPKAAEAFASVKTLAKQEIDRQRQRAEEAEAKLRDAEEKAKNPLTPEVEKELKELREFRLKLDVEADPEWKNFDAQVKSNEEAILAKLKSAGVDDAALTRIKEIGIADVDWDSLTDKLPSSVRRYIDTKLGENETVLEKKTKAIAAAKQNAEGFVREREGKLSQQAAARIEQTRAEVDKHLPSLGWMKVKPIPATAKPEERAALEAENALVNKVREDLKTVIDDDSPEMRAILSVSYAQLQRMRVDYGALKASQVAVEKAHSDEVAALKKERDEAKELLERIKKTSTTKIRGGGAPPAGEVTRPVKLDLNAPPGEALDRLRDEVAAGKGA